MTTTVIYFFSAINLMLALMMVFYNWRINKNVIFLALFLILLALESSMASTFNFGGNLTFYTFLFIISPIFFLKAPMLYFFVRGIVDDRFYMKKTDILHFIPFFLHILANMPFLLMSYEEQYQISANIMQNIEYYRQLRFSVYPLTWNNAGRAIQLFAYIIACFVLMRQVRYKLHQLRGQLKYQYKYTMQRITVILFLILLIATLLIILYHMFKMELDETELIHTMYFIIYMMAYIYFFIPIFVILSPKLLYGLPHLDTSHISVTQFDNDEEDETEKKTVVETQSQQLTTEYFTELASKILNYIDTEKPYLNPDFQIKNICIRFLIPQHHVHYCLNEILHTDFNELRNEKRIAYAKTIMKDKNNPVKPEDAGFVSGFTSNTNFNIAFKKYTGLTSEEWLNRQEKITD
ncbi:MAG: AraC family transcriptional regulator [Paludibacter sp.]|nr:AraC family transcriptional regulator [Paludibacter sp.]